jgi:hypothetical protein
MMDVSQLRRHLQGIGKICFVEHYELFREKSRIDPSVVVDILVKTGVSNEAGAKMRVGFAKRIFEAGRGNDALKIIVQSTGVPAEIRAKAKSLLDGDAVIPPFYRPVPISKLSKASVGVDRVNIIDSAILDYIHKATPSKLLALNAEVLDELRDRGIVRSANGPGGDYAELLFVEAFGWTRVTNSIAGYDAVDLSGNRYQVKSRRLHHPTTSRQLSALRNFADTPFDFLAGVLFNRNYSVMKAAIIPYNAIQPRFSKHTNGAIFFLEDRIWKLPDVRDVTKDLTNAATKIDGQL